MGVRGGKKMKFDKKSRIMNKFFAMILALALAVPMSMMFSTNAMADNIEYFPTSSSLDFEPFDGGEITSEMDNGFNLSMPTFDFERPYDNNYSIESELPIFEHVEEPYNITLVTMNSPTGPLYEEKRRPIQVILKNKADQNIKDINVEIYDQLDGGEFVFLPLTDR